MLARADTPAPRFVQPAFRRHWKAPKNSKGGFRSYEDMKAEAAAKTAAEYGPPQGPCASFRDNALSHSPVCFCGWHKGAHTLFGKGRANG